MVHDDDLPTEYVFIASSLTCHKGTVNVHQDHPPELLLQGNMSLVSSDLLTTAKLRRAVRSYQQTKPQHSLGMPGLHTLSTIVWRVPAIVHSEWSSNHLCCSENDGGRFS